MTRFLGRAAALLACALLAACQTFSSRQFAIPAEHRDAVVAGVARVARAHGMADCMAGSDAAGALGCFRSGDASFTFVGVREVDGRVIVDLSFRSAGIGGDLFKVLSEELRTDLRRTCGAAAVQELQGPQQVPIVHAPAAG